ncbi:hypothetical protein [Thalassotalea mangrovi]|uniref:Lipoprotein n=1 Tax=Thalassotalea mangrovi TaxID=2572245 RepID=A0A4U1B5A3_9GAMM|nr:hypothetical protein [Thalassotalea mangrovi]TKB45519.1 hypothetical protein E8M12_07905 [Thalassotalea mangrovi]
MAKSNFHKLSSLAGIGALTLIMTACSPARDEITVELVNVAKTGQCHQKMIFKNGTDRKVTLAGKVDYANGYHVRIDSLELPPNSTERKQYNILEEGEDGAEIFDCNTDVLNPQPKVQVSQCDLEGGSETECKALLRLL